MEKEVKLKAGMVSFGESYYPDHYLNRFTDESVKMLNGLGIDLVTAPIVKTFQDSGKASEILRKEDFDFLIVLILSWIEVPNVIETVQEFSHKPILLWSHTMFKENNEELTLGPIPAAVVVRQTFEELGLNFKFVYGMPEEEKVKREIHLFSKVCSTIRRLRHSKIGLLGYGSMGMYTAYFDHLPLKEKLGPEIEHLDQYVLIKRMQELEDDEVKELVGTAKKEWEIGAKVTENDTITTLKMYHALKSIATESNWSAVTVKCQYELSKILKHTPCVPLSIFGNELTCSCEGDIPLIVTQLILHYLTGKITSYGDIHTIGEDSILAAACGYAPFKLGEGRPKVDKTEVLLEGLANCTLYKEGRVTLARLGYQRDRDFKLHIVTGEAKKPRPFKEVGCLPFPAMEVILDGKTEEFAQEIMSQHYAIVYGDYKEELLEIAKYLSLTPIVV